MKNYILSSTRLARLRSQGYTCEGDKQLSEMAFGIRFAYRLCVAVIVTGIALQSVAVFSAMLIIAFGGVILPNHPFDYVYNSALSERMNKPKIPARSIQLKFACTIATLWLASVVYLLSAGFTTPALILAGLLAITATLPSTIDFCVPSFLFNVLFQGKKN